MDGGGLTLMNTQALQQRVKLLMQISRKKGVKSCASSARLLESSLNNRKTVWHINKVKLVLYGLKSRL